MHDVNLIKFQRDQSSFSDIKILLNLLEISPTNIKPVDYSASCVDANFLFFLFQALKG